eukprot:6474990-Amphidinium_carterae.1
MPISEKELGNLLVAADNQSYSRLVIQEGDQPPCFAGVFAVESTDVMLFLPLAFDPELNLREANEGALCWPCVQKRVRELRVCKRTTNWQRVLHNASIWIVVADRQILDLLSWAPPETAPETIRFGARNSTSWPVPKTSNPWCKLG